MVKVCFSAKVDLSDLGDQPSSRKVMFKRRRWWYKEGRPGFDMLLEKEFSVSQWARFTYMSLRRDADGDYWVTMTAIQSY